MTSLLGNNIGLTCHGQQTRLLLNIEPEFGGLGPHPQYEVHRRQVLNECWLAPAIVIEGIHVEYIV